MYKVGIVGAGVGGSYLSYLLSKMGLNNIILDFRAPHEKLCGGGVSYKTIAKFPILDELPCPRKKAWNATIISPKDRMVTLDLENPLTIFNRRDLDYSLLKKAVEFGAHFRKEKVQSFALEGGCWRIFTEKGDYRAEILVGADGALSRTRRKLGIPSAMKRGYFLAIECLLDVQRDFITFKYFPDLQGCLWAFPRVDSLAVGIASRDCTLKKYRDIKRKLFHFIDRYYPGQTEKVSLRGAYIPLFSAKGIQYQSICSNDWALIGDAATFVDPISGEGIYYAIYSAGILAECIIENKLPMYQKLCERYFCENLLKASQGFEYFYQTEFIETMVALAGKSQAIRQILSEMIIGNISYLSWKRRFRKNFFKILADFILNSDITIKQEVIANLVKLSPDYFRPYSRHKIS
jgi:geranylgeranyl reductase family protein